LGTWNIEMDIGGQVVVKGKKEDIEGYGNAIISYHQENIGIVEGIMKFKKMPFEAFDASCTSLLSWSNIRVPDSNAKLSIGHVLGSHYEMNATYRIFDENHQELAFLHQYGRPV